MRAGRDFVWVAVFLCAWMSASNATTTIAIASGNWNNPAIWQTGVVPGAGDDVLIDVGANVTLNVAGAKCILLTVGNGTFTISSPTASLTVSGDIVLGMGSNSGSIVMSGGILALTGTIITNAGSLQATGGTIEYTGANTTVADAKYYNLRLMNGNKTAGGDVIVQGDLTIDPAVKFSALSFTHRVGGNVVDQGDLNSSPGGTIIFNGDSPQSISGNGSFFNLTFSGSGTKTIEGNPTVTGDFTINQAATVAAGTANIFLWGNWTNNGSFSADQSVVETIGSNPMTFSGNTTFNTLLLFSGKVCTAAADLTVKGEIENFAPSTFEAGPWTHTFKGSVTNLGVFKPGNSTVVLGGSNLQSLSGSMKFNNLTLNNPGGARLLKADVDTILGVLDFSSGVLSIGKGELFLGANAVVNGAGAGTCIITNDTGTVRKRINGGMGAGSFTFPVAPDTGSYNPVTVSLRPLAGEPGESFNVRVFHLSSATPGFSGLDTSTYAWRVWSISEETSGGNHANFTFQWDRADQGSNSWVPKNKTVSAGVYRYDIPSTGFVLTEEAAGPAPFSGPLVASTSTFQTTAFGLFLVGPSPALPLELTSFTAAAVSGGGVDLKWTTLSEVNNYGFFVQKKRRSDSTWVEIPGAFVPGHGTTVDPHDYAYTDTAAAGGSWQYRLRQEDLNGSAHYSDVVSVAVTTSVEPVRNPSEFILFQNYPNPFNPSTMIRYSLPRAAYVRMELFSMLGQRVRMLVDEFQAPGLHEMNFDGTGLSSGVYVYRLRAGEYEGMKRLVIVR